MKRTTANVNALQTDDDENAVELEQESERNKKLTTQLGSVEILSKGQKYDLNAKKIIKKIEKNAQICQF